MRLTLRNLLATLAAASAALLLAVALAACGGGAGGGGDGRPQIVATTQVLGAVVKDVVGDRADVRVLMPAGVDPHDWQPSPRDIEAVGRADLVVANGLGLEAGLQDALDQARDDGVPVFLATDHVDVRRVGAGEAGDHGDAGAEDPHVWTDPASMERVVAALGVALRRDAGLDLGPQVAAERGRLTALDRETARTLAAIPPDRRRLVTGHESLGYLARRYGLEVVGAVIPGLSSQGGVSADALARLKQRIEAAGVDVVFAEAGTPRQVAEAIASETGARVVELAVETMPPDGRYATYMHQLAGTVASALAPRP